MAFANKIHQVAARAHCASVAIRVNHQAAKDAGSAAAVPPRLLLLLSFIAAAVVCCVLLRVVGGGDGVVPSKT